MSVTLTAQWLLVVLQGDAEMEAEPQQPAAESAAPAQQPAASPMEQFLQQFGRYGPVNLEISVKGSNCLFCIDQS